MGFSGYLIRKWGFSLVFLALIAVLAVLIGKRLPTSFIPDEDQGYVFVAMQLPDAASLQRTSGAARKVENISTHTAGVQGVTSVIGFSLLSRVQATYNAFFFVTLKPWNQRTQPDERIYGDPDECRTRSFASAGRHRVLVYAAAIPGVGTSGGVTFILEDRSGSGPEFLTENVNKFIAAARERRTGRCAVPTQLPNVPQLLVDVDRAKVMSQGVDIADVYQTMQTFMGGLLVNYFNRFGRQWQVYVEAEGESRTDPSNVGQFYVQNGRQRDGAPERCHEYQRALLARNSRCVTTSTARRKSIAPPRPATARDRQRQRWKRSFAQTMPGQMGFDYSGMSFQEQQAARGISPT